MISRKKILAGILVAAMVCTILPFHIQASQGLSVNYHTQQEIRDYISTSGADINMVSEYTIEPSVTSPYEPGQLTDATQQNALAILNQVRFIAGIDANVTLNQDYIDAAQAATLVNAVNDKMSHYPAKPADMDDDLYNLGYNGAGRSNLGSGAYYSSVGYQAYGTLGDSIIHGWAADDRGNIPTVGHRRWVLNPKMSSTGFGATYTYGLEESNGWQFYKTSYQTAMYAFDRGGSSSYTNVAWPAQNMPVEYFGASYPWSVSTGTAQDASAVRVVLTRESDQRQWVFSSEQADGDFYVNNGGYGTPGCVIFCPDGVEGYNHGDNFTVSITGLVNGDLEYTVRFFSLDNPENTDEQQYDTLTLPKGLKTIEENAFENVGAEMVIVPDECETIKSGAFVNCTRLKEISVPEGCIIADGACEQGVRITRRDNL